MTPRSVSRFVMWDSNKTTDQLDSSNQSRREFLTALVGLGVSTAISFRSLSAADNAMRKKSESPMQFRLWVFSDAHVGRDSAVKLIDGLAGESPASADYPVGTVVISGDGAGDQTVGSPDVNVLDGWTQVWSAPTGGQAKQQVVA